MKKDVIENFLAGLMVLFLHIAAVVAALYCFWTASKVLLQGILE